MNGVNHRMCSVPTYLFDIWGRSLALYRGKLICYNDFIQNVEIFA